MKYSRLFLVALSSFVFGITAANAQSNTMDDFFNENGEIASDLPTSYEMEDLKPIEFVNPRADDIYWQKVVYRVIDLRERMNYPLYYPEEANDGRESFFAIIFKLVNDRKVPAFRYNERTEKFNKDNLIDVEEDFLKKYDLIYKTKVNPTTKVKTFEVEDADIPNTEVIKYYVKEVWFFDKNSSTFNVKIISICPVLVTNKGVGIQSYPLFWIPFDNLRPYLVQREVMITDKNNGARMSYDDLFMKRRFASNIYKESNLQNRMILQYNATPEDVKREQERIKTDILNEEQDLWEY
ncbi:MAG: gliding motility protein GldN [Paludibacteraceae bacterium]|nr:gliding motility protein GldN [Paludibacteraceae bacterium]